MYICISNLRPIKLPTNQATTTSTSHNHPEKKITMGFSLPKVQFSVDDVCGEEQLGWCCGACLCC